MGQLLNLTFQRFKTCKLTSLFPPVTADKLVPSVLFLPNCRRGHYAAPTDTFHKLLHILIHQNLEWVVWELVNLGNGYFPYPA